jgi:hypothetical protein
MTLRDYFAAKALAGVDIATSVPYRLIATWCYSIADEMIKAREDKP